MTVRETDCSAEQRGVDNPRGNGLSKPEKKQENQLIAVGVTEAARLIGIGRSSYWKFAKDGILPITRVGRRSIVVLDELRMKIRNF